MEDHSEAFPRQDPVIVRPGLRLVALVLCAAFISLASMVFPSLVMSEVALIAVAVFALADWLVSRRDPKPQLERLLPARFVKGKAATMVYRLTRPCAPPTIVSMLDELPAELGGDLEFENINLGPSQRCELAREVMPRARGRYEVGPTYISWRSRLGLLQFCARALGGGRVAILPAAAMRRTGLTQRSLREELGLRPRTVRGEGMEFESMREYVDGDDPRHVDWHASARRGRMMVRQYQTERRHTVFVAVDTGRLMAARVDAVSKLDHALDCAVALAHASKEYGDRVGFVAFDRELRTLLRPRSGPNCAGALVEATLDLTAHQTEPRYRVLVETLAQCQKKRALVVVLTDFVEGSASSELESYLGVLARRHCVLLVALRDRLLAELDNREPEITRDRLYCRIALQDLAVERAAALARIRHFGAQTLDLDPADVTVPVLNRYLAIRQAALL
ncbi:MAG TPA: DUF58 domain-containing protein [Candidatus Binataceae bacterium]|nr:DUF58 domain-containing protein [Candidatus Binataceae bacterium]